jgi:hypothetical protein
LGRKICEKSVNDTGDCVIIKVPKMDDDINQGDARMIILLNQHNPVHSEIVYYCKKCKKIVKGNQHFRIYSTKLNLFVCEEQPNDLI